MIESAESVRWIRDVKAQIIECLVRCKIEEKHGANIAAIKLYWKAEGLKEALALYEKNA